MRSKTLTRCLMLIGLFSTLALHAQDWTTWRGPNANGTVSKAKWNPEALKTPKVLWKTDVGFGHSTVAIKKDRLYTMGTDFKVTDGDTVCQDRVLCLNAKTGQRIWDYAFDAQPTMFIGPRATPVLDGNRLYTVNWNGKVLCLNAKNGKLIWKRDVIADSLTRNHRWGISASPVVDGNLLIINVAKHGIAFNKKNGKTVWKSDYAQAGLATPRRFKYHGKALMAIVGIDSLYAVEAKTGRVAWSYRWHCFTDPLVIDDDHLFLMGSLVRGSKYKSVLIDMSADTLREVAGSRNLLAHFTTAVVKDDHAYGFAHVRRKQPMQCVNLKTGEEIWSEDLGRYGAHIMANGKLIIITGLGELIIADATPEGFNRLASTQVLHVPAYEDQKADTQKEWCWTIPVLSEGKIYVRDTAGEMVCINVSM